MRMIKNTGTVADKFQKIHTGTYVAAEKLVYMLIGFNWTVSARYPYRHILPSVK